jgi:hypothetical protein
MVKRSIKPQTLLAPVPAALISCGREDGEQNIITLAWVGVVNSVPPMISVAIRPSRHSHGIIKETGEFVVNIPTEDQVDIVDACGTLSGKNVNKFIRFNLTAEKGTLLHAPGIKECPISLLFYFIKRNSQSVCHALAISRIGFQAVSNMPDFDFLWGVSHSTGCILKKNCCCWEFIKSK